MYQRPLHMLSTNDTAFRVYVVAVIGVSVIAVLTATPLLLVCAGVLCAIIGITRAPHSLVVWSCAIAGVFGGLSMLLP